MKVAVLRETDPNETRVGLVPDGVKFLKKKLKGSLASFGIKLDLLKSGQVIFPPVISSCTYCYSVKH